MAVNASERACSQTGLGGLILLVHVRTPITRFLQLLACLTPAMFIGCADSTTIQGPSTNVGPPQITCPAPPAQSSPTGQPIPVSYAPVVTSGAEPVLTTCTPASGSPFSVGTTPVTCTATDVQRRMSTCSFMVSVTLPPRISATRFVAFGDSMTWGEDGTARLTSTRNLVDWNVPTVRLIGQEYPTVLHNLLTRRYTAQSIITTNEGYPGEKAADATTRARFIEALARHAPDVVLLLEGVNDIFGGTGGNPPGIQPAIANLRRMIGDARSRGVRVLLATLPPQNPAGVYGAQGYQTVPLMNAELRLLAASESVPLVDVFDAFAGNLTLLAPDGLHPNAQGYTTIANRFFDVIRARLEVAPTVSSGLSVSPAPVFPPSAR